MNFSSDNWAGASAPVMAALDNANRGLAPAYGADDHTRTCNDWFAEIFEREVDAFFVATGTAANSLSLSAVMRPGGVVLCHEASHVMVDEAGAPGFFSGGTLMPLPGEAGKLTAGTVEMAIRRYLPAAVHHGRPVAVSLTQATEWGTVYSPDEIRAIADVAHAHGLRVHMDGARFANALVSLGVQAADITWRAGVDLLSFGATKNGCWCAEAAVLFDPQLAEDFGYARKRAGQLLSKSRFVAGQFQGYFDQGHWLDNALHANSMAERLAAGIVQAPNARLAVHPQANEVFAIWSKRATQHLRTAGAAFYEWPAIGLPADANLRPNEDLIRLVTSFATTTHEVAGFLKALEEAA